MTPLTTKQCHMQKLTFLSVCILLSFFLSAQKGKNKDNNIPAFGSVEKSELEMKECDFDKNAEAVVLFDNAELEELDDLNLIHHIRIKILTNKGKDQADIKLRYYSFNDNGREEIKDISAQAYNLDASGNIVVTKVDKKLIYDKPIDKRFSEKIFTFPDVKAGTVIEYKYKRTNAGLIDWYFQKAIPVKYSAFTVDYSNEMDISFLPKCNQPYDDKRNETGTRTVRTFSMKNVPALRDEPYIINYDDYMQKIETKIIGYNINGKRINRIITWPDIIKALMQFEDFGIQIKKEIPRTADLDAQLKGMNDQYKRMITIHDYVRKNMEWNGIKGIWADQGIKAAWKDKKGTVGEINLILVNLLKDAGLDVKPILVSTHDNGLINTADAGTMGNPGYRRFNKVLAKVTIGNKIYYLDATDKETPSNLIPFEVVANEGLVIEKIETFDWGWESLWRDDLQEKDLILQNGVIGDDGILKGKVTINSYDYARLDRIKTARKGTKEFTERFLSSNQGATIDSVTFDNLGNDTLPLIQNVYFGQPLNESGDYKYFSINLFTGLEKNPFVADNRISDVFFGVKQNHSIVGTVFIPDGYEFDALPKNTRMIMPDTSISFMRVAQASDNMLSYRVTLDFNKPFYSTQEYDDFKEFYKKLFDLLNEQFVIKKKK